MIHDSEIFWVELLPGMPIDVEHGLQVGEVEEWLVPLVDIKA
jgi:hypothetical protein